MFKDDVEIKNDMLKNIENVSQNNFIHDAVSGTAVELARMYMELDYVASKLDVETLEGDELSGFIYHRTGLTRRPAVKASGDVVFTGVENTIIPRGTIVLSGSIKYVTTIEESVASTGTIRVPIEAVVSGNSSNVPLGSISDIEIAIPGVISVINDNALTNGYDEESDSVLLERYYERLRTPATSGNKYHYLIWAKEVPGVGAVKVYPLWNGPGTVKVMIVNSEHLPADVELIKTTLDNINDKRPIGADVSVVSGTVNNISITVKVKPADGISIQSIKEQFEKELEQYRKAIVFKESYVSYATVGNILFETSGVVDYSSLTLNNNVSNVSIADGELPIFNEIVMEVI